MLFFALFSLYFFEDEFYSDVKTLNEQENGGIGVVLGRKVRRGNDVIEKDLEFSFI